jgi:mycothiol synthase
MTTLLNETLKIPLTPAITGLRFRYFAGEPDFQAIVDVFNTCKDVDNIEYTFTLEGVRHHFEHLVRCDPYTDMIFVEIDGMPVAYGRVGWYPESNGDYIYYSLGWINPQWRRKGIGTAMLKHNESRIQEIAATHPVEVNKYFQNDHNDEQIGVAALLKANAYEPIRWGYEMIRPIEALLPEAPLPEGLEVRPVTEDHYPAIFWADNEAFRDHWGHSESTEEEYQRWLADPIIFKPELWKVAWDGNEVVGMVRNFLNEKENQEYGRQRGYTEFICVRRPWRRRGLAKSLLVQSIQMFTDMGYDETLLGVDVQNPNNALNLYQNVGYETSRESITYRKPLAW